MKNDFIVIIAAAGTSSRMNGINKLFVNVNNKPIIIHTLEKFKKFKIILACNEKYIKKMYNITSKYKLNIFKIVPGDNSRNKTIYKALLQVPLNIRNIIIHDGARPCITNTLINKLIRSFKVNNSVSIMPILKVNDSIKIKEKEKYKNIDRNKLFLVQTPQIFDKEILNNAFYHAIKNDKFDFSDETSLLEYIGYQTKTIFGDISNIKITTRDDIKLIKKIIGEKNEY